MVLAALRQPSCVKRGGCYSGEAYDAASQIFVLDFCGQQEGHFWKQLDLFTNYEEVRKVSKKTEDVSIPKHGPVLLATAAKLGIGQERSTRDKPTQ